MFKTYFLTQMERKLRKFVKSFSFFFEKKYQLSYFKKILRNKLQNLRHQKLMGIKMAFGF